MTLLGWLALGWLYGWGVWYPVWGNQGFEGWKVLDVALVLLWPLVFPTAALLMTARAVLSRSPVEGRGRGL